MRAKNEMDSRLYLRLVRACFILAAVVLAFGVGKWMQRDVYAGSSLDGGTYKASKIAGTNWTVNGDITIEMDEDATLGTLDATGHDITIKGNKTLTISGNTNLIEVDNLTVEDTTLKMTVNEAASDATYAIYADNDISLKNVNLEIDNPAGEGIYADAGDIIIEGSSVKIDSYRTCIDVDGDNLNVNETELNLKASKNGGLRVHRNVYIRNSKGNIDSVYGNWAVSGNGDVVNCLYPYIIASVHIFDCDWINAFHAKAWSKSSNEKDLASALLRAKEILVKSKKFKL